MIGWPRCFSFQNGQRKDENVERAKEHPAGSESVTRKSNLSCKLVDGGVLGKLPQSFASIVDQVGGGCWLVSGRRAQ